MSVVNDGPMNSPVNKTQGGFKIQVRTRACNTFGSRAASKACLARPTRDGPHRSEHFRLRQPRLHGWTSLSRPLSVSYHAVVYQRFAQVCVDSPQRSTGYMPHVQYRVRCTTNLPKCAAPTRYAHASALCGARVGRDASRCVALLTRTVCVCIRTPEHAHAPQATRPHVRVLLTWGAGRRASAAL